MPSVTCASPWLLPTVSWNWLLLKTQGWMSSAVLMFPFWSRAWSQIRSAFWAENGGESHEALSISSTCTAACFLYKSSWQWLSFLVCIFQLCRAVSIVHESWRVFVISTANSQREYQTGPTPSLCYSQTRWDQWSSITPFVEFLFHAHSFYSLERKKNPFR